MGLANRLILALKMNMLAKRQRQGDSDRDNERPTAMSDGGDEYSTAYSDIFTVSRMKTTTLTLQDMIAAPDDGQPQQPSSPDQLREPLLELLEKEEHIA